MHIGFNEFKIINWIPVSERVKQIKLNNMFRIFHGTAPKYLRDSFFMVSQHVKNMTDTPEQVCNPWGEMGHTRFVCLYA